MAKVVIAAPHDGYDKNTGRMAEFMSGALYGQSDLAVKMRGRQYGKIDINRPGETRQGKEVFKAYMDKIERTSKKIPQTGLGALLIKQSPSMKQDDIFLVEIHGKKDESGRKGYVEIATKGLNRYEELFFKELLEEGVRYEKQRTKQEEGRNVGWIDEKGVGDDEVIFKASEAREEGSFSRVKKGIHVELAARLRISPYNEEKLTLEGRCVHRALSAALAVYSGLKPKGNKIQKTYRHLRNYSKSMH